MGNLRFLRMRYEAPIDPRSPQRCISCSRHSRIGERSGFRSGTRMWILGPRAGAWYLYELLTQQTLDVSTWAPSGLRLICLDERFASVDRKCGPGSTAPRLKRQTFLGNPLCPCVSAKTKQKRGEDIPKNPHLAKEATEAIVEGCESPRGFLWLRAGLPTNLSTKGKTKRHAIERREKECRV